MSQEEEAKIQAAVRVAMSQMNGSIPTQIMPPMQAQPMFAPAAPQFAPQQQMAPAMGGALPNPTGWSVPVEMPVNGPMGPSEVTVYIQFPAESLASAPAIINTLSAMGYKVRTFQPRQQFGGGGFGGGGFNQGGGYPGRYNRWGR